MVAKRAIQKTIEKRNLLGKKVTAPRHEKGPMCPGHSSLPTTVERMQAVNKLMWFHLTGQWHPFVSCRLAVRGLSLSEAAKQTTIVYKTCNN